MGKKHNKELVEKSPREIQNEALEKHTEDLCVTTRQVLAELYEYYTWPDDMTIEETNYERDDPKLIGLFRDELVIGVFEQLKADIEKLKPFTRWEDIRPMNIDDNLLTSISNRAASRDFKGKCHICESVLSKSST